MREKFNKFLKNFGWLGIFKLIFSPIIVVVTTPFRFFQALWSCRVLADGKWGQYNRFNPHRAINSLFYWTQAVNIDKYGMNGFSPTIGDGKFYLSNLFQLSLPSVYSYWRFGAVAPILGMFGWLFFHFVWIDSIETSILLLVLLAVMLSSTFYANIFEMQNYNAIGWAFFPIGLYGLYTGNYELAAFGWLLTTFGSFTAWFTGGVLSFIYSVTIFSFEPLLWFIPSVLKMTLHFIPLIKKGDLLQHCNKVLIMLGSKKNKVVKYTRKKNQLSLISTAYFTILYLQFIILYFLQSNSVDIFFITMFILFVLNNMQIVRYADPGSLHVPILSVATIMVLNDFSIMLFISYLILINPMALFLDFSDSEKSLDVVPKREPFFIQPLVDEMDTFLQAISKKDRVLFSFENPNGNYGDVFNGQRVNLELALYTASEKEIHLFPDLYLVFQDNTTDDLPNFWGRDLISIGQIVKEWDCQYVLYYSKDKSEEIFYDKNYRIVSSLNWDSLYKKYYFSISNKLNGISWYLFEVKND